MLSLLVLLIYLPLQVLANLSPSVIAEVADFLRDNGKKYVDVLTSHAFDVTSFSRSLIDSENGFYARKVNVSLLSGREMDLKNFHISILEDQGDDLNYTLHFISKTRRQSSLIIFTSDLNTEAWNNFRARMEQLQRNSFFYMAYVNEGGALEWYQIISLNFNSNFTINKLNFKDNSKVIEESYDFHGNIITSYSLTWAPYLTLTNCDKNGTNCDNFGFLMDYMTCIGKLFNFTFESIQDPDGNWGVRPDENGVYSGVMGAVVNGKYPLALSEWNYIYERYDLLDFVTTTTNTLMLALTPQPAPVDTGLFIRPFKEESWTAILIMTFIIILVVVVPYFTYSFFENTSGYMIASTTGWYFFVLLNAYYGGALTMFFTSETTLPFRSITDVMRSYPDWKLLMMNGNDVHFQYKAQQGDPDYATFWDRVENQREETVFETVEEGLIRIANERAVMHVFDGMLRGFFRDNPFYQQRLKIFARQKPIFNAIIVNKNSPLKPMFDLGTRFLRENGVIEQMLKDWTGGEIQEVDGVEKMVLSPGQVILVYMVMGGAMCTSFMALVLEFCWSRTFSKGLTERKETVVAGWRNEAVEDAMHVWDRMVEKTRSKWTMYTGAN